MNLRDITGAHCGLGVIAGLGAGLLSLHAVHATGAGENVRTVLPWILLPAAFAAGVLAGGVWLQRRDIDGEYFPRVAGWCVLGAGVLAFGPVLTIRYQRAEGVIVSDRLFVVANAASGGGLAGFLVGVYDSRQRIARVEVDRLSQRLTVLADSTHNQTRPSPAAVRPSYRPRPRRPARKP